MSIVKQGFVELKRKTFYQQRYIEIDQEQFRYYKKQKNSVEFRGAYDLKNLKVQKIVRDNILNEILISDLVAPINKDDAIQIKIKPLGKSKSNQYIEELQEWYETLKHLILKQIQKNDQTQQQTNTQNTINQQNKNNFNASQQSFDEIVDKSSHLSPRISNQELNEYQPKNQFPQSQTDNIGGRQENNGLQQQIQQQSMFEKMNEKLQNKTQQDQYKNKNNVWGLYYKGLDTDSYIGFLSQPEVLHAKLKRFLEPFKFNLFDNKFRTDQGTKIYIQKKQIDQSIYRYKQMLDFGFLALYIIFGFITLFYIPYKCYQFIGGEIFVLYTGWLALLFKYVGPYTISPLNKINKQKDIEFAEKLRIANMIKEEVVYQQTHQNNNQQSVKYKAGDKIRIITKNELPYNINEVIFAILDVDQRKNILNPHILKLEKDDFYYRSGYKKEKLMSAWYNNTLEYQRKHPQNSKKQAETYILQYVLQTDKQAEQTEQNCNSQSVFIYEEESFNRNCGGQEAYDIKRVFEITQKEQQLTEVTYYTDLVWETKCHLNTNPDKNLEECLKNSNQAFPYMIEKIPTYIQMQKQNPQSAFLEYQKKYFTRNFPEYFKEKSLGLGGSIKSIFQTVKNVNTAVDFLDKIGKEVKNELQKN